MKLTHCRHYYLRRSGELAKCSAQTWAANSLSRWAPYSCFISSSDSLTIALEGLNTQVHSEQPKPSKFSFSIHTNLRGIAAVYAKLCPK